ncbi:uncharacterized protein BDW70DRAFT_165394 [Aspergillus foveolatus]|uniref:uncharacterized protein n=1 Tax=Aspergillus foveolatus TaxID=210207 RepID=UPI003CCD0278
MAIQQLLLGPQRQMRVALPFYQGHFPALVHYSIAVNVYRARYNQHQYRHRYFYN